MELTTPINLNLLEKLKKRSYFHKFFLARARDEIAQRIRDLRKLRKLNQGEFAERAGMKQPAISRIEQAEYAGWNFKTLARVAEALDVRLQIILTPMEDVINEYETAETIVQVTTATKRAAGEISKQGSYQVSPAEPLLKRLSEYKGNDIAWYHQKSSRLALSTNSKARTGAAARANQQSSSTLPVC